MVELLKALIFKLTLKIKRSNTKTVYKVITDEEVYGE